MGKISERQIESYKIWTVAVLLTGVCLSLYYFHVILRTGTIVTHLFYVPIILASIWWKRKGLVVALFSSGFLIFSHVFLRPDAAAYNDYLRAFMFMVTAFVVAELSRRIAKEQEALRAANQQLTAGEQQLKAANQQLRANEQQLVSEITERKKAESALRETTRFLETIFDTTHVLIAHMDPQFNFIKVNRAYALADEKEPSFFPGKNHFDLYPNEENEAIFRRVVETAESYFADAKPFEYAEHPERGVSYWDWSLIPIKNQNNDITGLVLSLINVTKRELAEKALRESEGKLSAMLQSVADPMRMMDKDLNIIWANETAMKIFGDDIVGRKCYEAYHRRNNPCEPYPCLTLKAFQDGKIHEHDTQVVDKEGQKRYFHCIANVALRDSEGKPTTVLDISRDITDRKQVEEALRESENSYRAVVENAVEGIVVAQGQMLQFVNPSLVSMIGYSEKELLTRPFIEFIHPDHREWAMGMHIKRLKGEEVPPVYEFKVVDKKGNTKWLENNGILIEWRNRPATLNFLRDITERKKSQEALKYRMEFERLITMLSKRFIDPGDIDEKINEALKAIGQFAQVDRAYVFQLRDNSKTVDNTHEWCAEGIETQIENLRGITLDDELPWFWGKIKAHETLHVPVVADLPPEAHLEKKHFERQGIRALVVVPMLSKGVLKGFLGFDSVRAQKTWAEDIITLLRISGESISLALEREHAEQALKESEIKFRSLTEEALVGVYLVQDGMIKYINPKLAKIFGYSADELIDKKGPDELVFPEDWTLAKENLRRKMAGEVKSIQYNFRGVTKDKKVIYVEVYGSATQYQGRPAVIGTLRDITERRRADEALRSERDKLQSLMEGLARTKIGIDIVDTNYRILFQNKTLIESFGEHTGELCYEKYMGLKKPCDFCPMKETIKTKEVEFVELTAIDGKSYELLSAPFANPDGTIDKAIEVVTDITGRKLAKEKLLEYQEQLKSLASQLSLIEERERHHIATELHDQIGQSLVMSKMKLDSLRHSVSSSESAKVVEEVSGCLGQIIQDTRTLTFDLSSPILYELGFEAAVAEWLTEQIQDKHGIKTEFEDDGQSKPLDDDMRVLLFRNVRELLVNVVKHANAKNIKVSIWKMDKKICVRVEDDGMGFDFTEVESMVTKKAKFGLFSIQERLESVGGRFEIKSKVGQGSRITMTAPLKYEKTTNGAQV